MSLLKYLVFGAAVAAGVTYATKKREDGTSLLDDLTEKAPEYIDRIKQYADQVRGQFSQTGNPSQNTATSGFDQENPPY